jgi:type IV secretory pathway VirB10-like protein
LGAIWRRHAGLGHRRRRSKRGAVRRGGSGTVIVNPSATQDVMTEVLKGTINIPPTVVKQQGDRIQVLGGARFGFQVGL